MVHNAVRHSKPGRSSVGAMPLHQHPVGMPHQSHGGNRGVVPVASQIWQVYMSRMAELAAMIFARGCCIRFVNARPGVRNSS